MQPFKTGERTILKSTFLEVKVYLKVKIEIEEIIWQGATARKQLIYSGYVHLHSKKKRGERTVLLQRKIASENYDQTALVTFRAQTERETEKRLRLGHFFF